MSGVHARDGQRRNATAMRIRDTWVRARKRLRSALAWYLNVDDWRRIPGDVRALNAILLDALRSPAPARHPVQGPRPGDPPQGGSYGAVRAGASDPDTPVDYWPAYYPPPLIPRRVYPRAAGGTPAATPVAGVLEVPAPATCPPGGAGASLKLRPAVPEAPAAPASPGAARPPWDAWQQPSGTLRYGWRGDAERRRETIAMAVLRDPVPPYYRAHLARQDAAAVGA